MTKVIQSYNKTAVALLQYEALHLQGWSQAAESAPQSLNAALLVRRENSKVQKLLHKLHLKRNIWNAVTDVLFIVIGLMPEWCHL